MADTNVMKFPQVTPEQKLQRKLKTTMSGRRGARRSLTNIRKRTKDLVEHLEAHVIPTLKTTRQAQCAALVRRVRKLL